MKMRLLISVAVAAVALGGCGMMEPKKVDYKSAGKLPPLDIPPDLTQPTKDEKYTVPDITPKGSANVPPVPCNRN